MKQLEIIEICSVHADRDRLEKQISELCGQVSAASVDVDLKVYMHGFVAGEFSIHLLQEIRKKSVLKSAIGEQLAAALREFGMVNHSVWIQRQ